MIVTTLRRCADDSLCKCCNCELYCEKNCVGVLKNDAADLIEKLVADRKDLINELCQYCGKYKQAHDGACDGCNLRKLLGQPAGFGGGCCGWALSGAPTEVDIEILETALAVEEEKGDSKWTL